jgi:hypothetical protein
MRRQPVKIYKKSLSRKSFLIEDTYVMSKLPLKGYVQFLSKHFLKFLLKWGYLKNDMGDITVEDWTLNTDQQEKITNRVVEQVNELMMHENVMRNQCIAYVGRDEFMDILSEDYIQSMPMHGYRDEVRMNTEYGRVMAQGITVQLVPWMQGILVVPKKMLHN